MDEQASVRLITALSAAWSAIRARNPEVPPVVLLPAPAQRGRLNVLGHFAALRWQAKKQTGQFLHEVVVVAEHLDRGGDDIFETLLHEAAHSLCEERGVPHCSRSQYHNRNFAAAAEELGLVVTQVQHYGFALTSLPEATALAYAQVIVDLDDALVHRRKPASVVPPTPPDGGETPNGGEDTTPQGRSRKATCACPFIIRVSKKTIEATVIRCERCGETFRLT
jgi:hypothetical protein